MNVSADFKPVPTRAALALQKKQENTEFQAHVFHESHFQSKSGTKAGRRRPKIAQNQGGRHGTESRIRYQEGAPRGAQFCDQKPACDQKQEQNGNVSADQAGRQAAEEGLQKLQGAEGRTPAAEEYSRGAQEVPSVGQKSNGRRQRQMPNKIAKGAQRQEARARFTHRSALRQGAAQV